MFAIIIHEFGNIGPMFPYLKECLSNLTSGAYQYRMAVLTEAA